jgi:hypothetical protein
MLGYPTPHTHDSNGIANKQFVVAGGGGVDFTSLLHGPRGLAGTPRQNEKEDLLQLQTEVVWLFIWGNSADFIYL